MDKAAIDLGNICKATTLFALSFRQHDDLVRIVYSAGYHAIIATTGHDPVADYSASGASVVLVDARGAVQAGLVATRALGALAATDGTAVLVLVSRDDEEAIEEFYVAGATHFLTDPVGEGEIVQALKFAARYADRAAGAMERRVILGEVPSDGGMGDAQRWIGERIAAMRPVAVALVSLSRLDIVNAAHGRPAVDALIENAVRRARIVAAGVTDADAMVARLGGSEFVLMIGAVGAPVVTATAALDAALARPFAVADTRAVLGCRFGIAQYQPGAEHQPGNDAATLLRRAREALTEAKASDGTVLHVASPDGRMSLDALAIDLHHAIDLDEIDLRFQPQVEIASGRITGVEALARWTHRKLGPLGADILFAAAERADLGIALSDHIQRLVLARAVAWPAALQTLRVSLNLTAADIARPGFAPLFLARVDASGFPRGRLTVEITETGLIEDLVAASSLLAELRGAGCRVAIDDFGTGYSSLAYLKDLPLDYVKIDKALVHDICGSPRDRVVVAGAITMARSLGFAVVAEGVETPAQLDLLAAGGCSLYQGFLLSEPVDEAALLELMEQAGKS